MTTTSRHRHGGSDESSHQVISAALQDLSQARDLLAEQQTASGQPAAGQAAAMDAGKERQDLHVPCGQQLKV